MSKYVLEIAGLTKSFGENTVLSDISLRIGPGEIHGLLGHNGSGKSTLIKILSGYHSADKVDLVELDGIPVPVLAIGPRARDFPIRFVHQDLGLVESLTVAENLALGRRDDDPWWRLRGKRALEEQARTVLTQIGISLNPGILVSRLSPAERTFVAIARALQDWSLPRGLIVLDEPTAALPKKDANELLSKIVALSKNGTSFLYVTHHLDEVRRVANDITVLKDGVVVLQTSAAEISHDELLNIVAGRDISHSRRATKVGGKTQDPLLVVKNLNGKTLRNFSLEVLPGSIVGITGLVGSGAEEVGKQIFGSEPAVSGIVKFLGQHYQYRSPKRSLRKGISYLPAERARNGTFSNLTIRENITISSFADISRAGVLLLAAEKEEVSKLVRSLHLIPNNPELRISSLSGGNQQKALLARSLRLRPQLMLLDEPTQGVDVGAQSAIGDMIISAAQSGAAVIIMSSELEFMLSIADRVIVLREGELVADLEGASLTEKQIIGNLMPSETYGAN